MNDRNPLSACVLQHHLRVCAALGRVALLAALAWYAIPRFIGASASWPAAHAPMMGALVLFLLTETAYACHRLSARTPR
jgi:hypothetical protein